MDSRLPEASLRRYRQNSRRGSDRIGPVLVVCAAVGAFVALGSIVVVDMSPIVRLPEELGFTMFFGHPKSTRAGFSAPLFSTVAPADGCGPEHATFALGMADLKGVLGPVMGEPRDCEQPADANGNTVQLT